MLITAALMVCTKKHPNISEEEVKFIESMVRPMELGGND